jgi:YVTN family beta-propeller protein
VVDNIEVGIDPASIEFSPITKNMYVANEGGDSVSVIDQNNVVVDTIKVGDHPSAISYNPGNGYIYVVNQFSNTVSVIGSTSVIDRGTIKGILGSGNNVNIQIQDNHGNIAGGQSGLGEPDLGSLNSQEQRTDQDSQVIS